MRGQWEKRLSFLEWTAIAKETATTKPLLPAWLLEEVQRQGVVVANDSVLRPREGHIQGGRGSGIGADNVKLTLSTFRLPPS